MASNKPRAPKALPPDVKRALEQAVKTAGSQVAVGRELNCSNAVVSQLLRDAYLGDVATYADRIRGKYMAETVTCPVQGTLPRDVCLDNQRRPFAATNPVRTALFKACKTCPNRKEAS